MAPPLILRIITDAQQAFRTNDALIGSYTKVGDAMLSVGADAELSAKAQIAANLKAIQASRARVAAITAENAKLAKSGDAAIAGQVALSKAQADLNRSLGITAVTTRGTSAAVKEGDRDLGKFTRGALAGSGAANELGRSLAFASTGFIAIAGTATILKESISAAVDLASTQRSVGAQLKTSGKSWDDYRERITKTDERLSHISGFTNQELLQSFGYLVRPTGNVSEALKLNAVAADVARGRHIALSSAAIALAKALGGSETALRRLGITIPKNVKGMDALNYVQQKFAGQARASTTVGQRFHATLVDTGEVIGTELLPTFNRLTTEVSNYLTRLIKSGELQRDVNDIVRVGGVVFHTLGDAIHLVDKATGSFGNTLKIILGVYLSREILGGIAYVDKLAASWAGVATEANAAAAAEARAAGGGAVADAGVAGAEVAAAGGAGRAGSGFAALLGRGGTSSTATRTILSESQVANLRFKTAAGELTTVTRTATGGLAVATGAMESLGTLLEGLGPLAAVFGALAVATNKQVQEAARKVYNDARQLPNNYNFLRPSFLASTGKDVLSTDQSILRALGPVGTVIGNATGLAFIDRAVLGAETVGQKMGDAFTANAEANAKKGVFAPKLPGPLGRAVQQVGTPAGVHMPQAYPFGLPRIAVYKSYQQTISEQIAAAQAQLTKTTKDDVAAAKAIIARIKKLIAEGHLAGQSLVQALQDEATQEGVLASARQQAAARAAKIAAAKKAAASSYTTPIDLQLAEARAELTATSKDDIAVEKKILAAAKAAIASGKKNKQGQLAALQVELQAQQALQSLKGQSATTYTLPAKLELALARAQATGGDVTAILLKEKAALEKALKASKGNILKQTDIYNQIAAINAQLGGDIVGAYGDYKKASLKSLTAGLGLTPAQRRALGAKLSQLGPGGTTPMTGVGAGGFIIDPTTGRPIHRGGGGKGSSYGSGGGGGKPPTVNANINLNIYLDGKQITAVVTKGQQHNNRNRPTQRRGPNAATR